MSSIGRAMDLSGLRPWARARPRSHRALPALANAGVCVARSSEQPQGLTRQRVAGLALARGRCRSFQRTPSRTDRRASHRPMSVSRVERTASGASPVSAWRAPPLHVDGAARPANAVTDRPSSASGRLHTLEVSSAFPPSDPGASEHSTKPQTRHISAVLFNLYIHTYL